LENSIWFAAMVVFICVAAVVIFEGSKCSFFEDLFKANLWQWLQNYELRTTE
jgi:hypothetical protein